MLATALPPNDSLKVIEAAAEEFGIMKKTYAETFDRTTAAWRRSRRSNGGGNCVEVAPLADRGAAVRDSTDPDGPILFFTPGEWDAFRGGMKDGDFDN